MRVEIEKRSNGAICGVLIDGQRVDVTEEDGIHLQPTGGPLTLVTLTLIADDVDVHYYEEDTPAPSFELSADHVERRQQIKAIRSASFEVESFASALSMLCAQLVQHPGLRDLVLAETNQALRERFEGLGELVDGRISGALSCLLSLQPRHAGLLDAAVLDHENSLAGHGADPDTAPMASGEAATSPVGDTVRDATDTPSPRLAGRAGDVRGGGATSPGRGSAG